MDLMVSPVKFSSTAERWVRQRGSGDGDDPPFEIDGEGFFREPDLNSGGWMRPADAAGHGAWVLLGEPGAGKTTAFTELVPEGERDSLPDPGEAGTLWLTGAELDSVQAVDNRLGDHLKALPLVSDGDAGAGPPSLRIVIDQLDESAYLPNFPGWLKRHLRGRDTRNLRIWLACRTADYPSALTDVLTAALGTCALGDLAPLSRKDAESLVDGTGIDVDGFFPAVINSGAGVLASVPLTLMVLLNAHQQDPAAIARGPLALFRLGVKVIADVHAPEKAGKQSSTVEQRVAIASRIATHLLLSGRRAVHFHSLGTTADHTVPLGSVVGASEIAGAGAFEVTKAAVEETLATALFDRRHSPVAPFAHSSFAAFLAAQHLAARLAEPDPMPRRQLEELFLVSAPDEDSAAIPEHLRETAAWLIAHEPEQMRWLAVTDPEGLVAHANLIVCQHTRAAMVEKLLERADRIELGERSWIRSRWELGHAGIGEQLGPVLSAAVESPDEWTSYARARLAIRLARDSDIPGLADPLLRVVETPQWPVSLRQSAAKAAMALAPDEPTFARLREVLGGLLPSEADYADGSPVGAESPLELVGTLLNLLWPEHIDFADVAPHIRPVPAHSMIGMYWLQVHEFPRRVADSDLPALLDCTEAVLAKYGVQLESPDPDALHEDVDEVPTISSTPVPWILTWENARSLQDFALPVADRVLGSAHAEELLGRVAPILLWFLSGSKTMSMPLAVDLVGEDDEAESDATRTLRRSLAEALIRAARKRDPERLSYWIYKVVAGWGNPSLSANRNVPPGFRRGKRARLLDADDAHWVASRQEHFDAAGDSLLATNLSDLAAGLAQPAQETPPMQAVELWKDAEPFASLQRERLDKAVKGDATAFWHWVKYLSVDPLTGQWTSAHSWRAVSYAGASLWPEDELRTKLGTAASLYINNQTDDREEWLGLTGDHRAEAGMLALTHLVTEGHDEGAVPAETGLATISAEAWGNWAGAILDNVDRFGASDHHDQALLDRVALCAPDQLASAVNQYVRTRLARSQTVLRFQYLPPVLSGLLTELADELDSALRTPPTPDTTPDSDGETTPTVVTQGPIVLPTSTAARESAIITWAAILQLPVGLNDPRAIKLAIDTIAAHQTHPHPETGLKLAASAARLLLEFDAPGHWTLVQEQISGSPAFARALAAHCAQRDVRHTITNSLDERALSQLYDWLVTTCPPETEVYGPGFTAVTAEHEMHHWRREAIQALGNRGTNEAVAELRGLTLRYPTLLDIQAALHEARRRAQAKMVNLLTPAEVAILLNDSSRRVVRTAGQLADVLIDTLEQIERDISSHPNVLWDCERADRSKGDASRSRLKLVWRPKVEGTVSTYIAHELNLRLGKRRVVINREVVIRPTDAGDSGERPDIKIDILGTEVGVPNPTEVTVPIELKGSWHRDVLTAQQTQLAVRYLEDLNTTDGVYLVAWFALEHWNIPPAKDGRRSKAAKHISAVELLETLRTQADDIQVATGRRTRPFVMVVPRATSPDDRIMKSAKR